MNTGVKAPLLPYSVLFVDDEERILRTLTILFRPHARVFATSDPEEALRLVVDEDIDVVVSDQRMPAVSGTELLARIRDIAPQTVRMLLTGYSEVESAIGAVNDGEIHRYLTKPWTVESILRAVRDAATVAQLRRQAAGMPPPAAPVAVRPIEILVIDEDASTRAAVSALLPGRTVHAATTLGQAVEVIGTRPVGVLVTEAMVNGDDMTHLLRTLKQVQPELVCIVVTALHDTPRLIRLINQAQVFRFLPKPLRSGMLARSLESAIERYQATAGAVQLVPGELRVDEAATEVERTLSQRIGSYLGRLRNRAPVDNRVAAR